MESRRKQAACLLAGLMLAAGDAMPQAYTVSAKAGAVNYVEGAAYINGAPVSEKNLKSTYLNANDILSTDLGKAEVLLAPGVFLRIGDNSKVRMVSPSLVDTQIEVMNGEAMVEATGLVKGSSVQVISHGASANIEKNGLYRILADDPPSIAVLDGKAAVTFSDKTVNLKKGRQVILAENLKPEKFDTKKDDELYAWSNVRSEYDAAATYRVARSAQMGLLGNAYSAGMANPGWFWDSAFSSWAWLPGAGAFYSPFGYGFYSPGLVGYAPVIAAPVYRGGNWSGGRWNGTHTPPANGWRGGQHPIGPGAANGGVMAAVPVSPNNPAAVGSVTANPWANHAARMQMRQRLEGMNTASGAPAGTFTGRGANARPGGGASQGGAHPGGWSGAHQGGGNWSGAHQGGGGWSGAHQGGGGWSGAHQGGGGGAHMSGGGGGGGGHAGGGGGGHR
jgi:hypothetical protein